MEALANQVPPSHRPPTASLATNGSTAHHADREGDLLHRPEKRIPLLRLKASGQWESHSVTRVATERNRLGAMLKDKVMTWATLFR